MILEIPDLSFCVPLTVSPIIQLMAEMQWDNLTSKLGTQDVNGRLCPGTSMANTSGTTITAIHPHIKLYRSHLTKSYNILASNRLPTTRPTDPGQSPQNHHSHQFRKNMSTTNPLDNPSMTLRSGLTIGKWHIAQARRRQTTNIVGHIIESSSTDPPKPMSDVFNIPELLEPILLNLPLGFLLQTAQLVCSGFKRSIEASLTVRQKTTSVIHVDDELNGGGGGGGNNAATFAFTINLRPKAMLPNRRHRSSRYKPRFVFTDKTSTFDEHRQHMGRLRGMHAFDRVPQYIFVHWKDGQGGMGSAAWEVEGGGDAVTFGEIFDVVATKKEPGDRVVKELHVVWSASRGY